MFYDIFVKLCRRKGISPSKAAEECGINRSNVTSWKNNGHTPRSEALNAIADYFGVTTDYLLGNEQKEKPAEKASVTDDDIKFALSGGEDVITDAQYDEVKKFVQFIKERDKRDKS